MFIDSELIILIPIIITPIVIMGYLISRKRKRSAKSIYKLIDDLEKKYIY